MGHLLGAEKINFLIRDIDDATMAAASMESCRFVVLWSLGGRWGRYWTREIAYAACVAASIAGYI